jgi:glycosyltransferase involved in cell wall biosynthesis
MNIASAAGPKNPAGFRLVTIGGLVVGKRQEDAVLALSYLVQGGIDAELLLVGESYPSYRETLEQIVKSNDLTERVHFIGYVPDASWVLQSADVLLICSRSEAFGRVTIEAMLAGKPVVGAACGATLELVQEGFNGLLYRGGDAMDLATRLKFLAENPPIMRRLGENGRAWASSHFTKDRYASDIKLVLSSAAKIEQLEVVQ